MKKCPFCGADIEDSARFCLYCMQPLTEKEQILPHPKKKPQRWLTVAAIAMILLIPVLIWLVRRSAPVPSGDISAPSTSQTVPTDTPSITEPPHTHSFSVANTSVEFMKEAATCTTPAVFYYSCTCGEMGSSTFYHGEPNAHTVVTDPGYSANCSTPGLTEGTRCSACNTVLLAQTPLPVTNHTFDNDQDDTCNVCNFVRVINCNHRETVSLSAIPATCIAGGLTEGKKCTLCEEILTAQTVLAPLGHTEVTDRAVAATCTTDGLTEGKHCATCHTIFIAQSTIAAKGHTKVVDQAVAATCTTEGKTEGAHCSVCNTVLWAQTPMPVTNHTFDNERDESCNVCNYVRVVLCDHAETVKLSAVAPTCIASGLTEGKKCAFCEEILTAQTTLAPLGHTEVTDPAIAPTCVTGGLTEGKHCSTCHAVLVAQFPVAAKGHTRVIDQAVAATCSKGGKTEGAHCSVCQVVFLYQQTTNPLGHSFDPEDASAPCSRCGFVPHIHSFTEKNTDAKYLKSAASCEQAAQYYYSCICGKKGEPYFHYGSETGHTFVTEPGYPPTCTTTGLTDRVYCSVCDFTLYYEFDIEETGHSFDPEDATAPCSRCGLAPHIHSFTEKNTDTKYLKRPAECTSAAIYYYSCTCGEKGYDTFVYGTSIGHNVVIESGYPAGCTTPGVTDLIYCTICHDTLDYYTEIQPKGHTFALSDSLSPCLVCGEMGTITVRFSDNLYYQTDIYRIDSCTYTVCATSYGDLEFNFSITYTNISDTRSPVVDFSLYSYGLGYALSGGRLMPLDPNESGSCTDFIIVTNLGDTYELRMREIK